MSSSMVDLLRGEAERCPSAPVLLGPGGAPLTYGQLIGLVDAAGGRLRGRRVAMVFPDGVEMAAAVLGVSAGATCIPLNPALRARELEAVLARSTADTLLVPAGSASPAVAVARARGMAVVEWPMPGETRAVRASAQADDPMLVLPTSGTTAEPKLVTLSHRNVVAAARAIGSALELTAADRCLSVMPLFHIHGLSAIFASVAAGGSVVCPAGFSPHAFFDWLEELRPTWYTASPAIHRAILEEGRRQPGRAAKTSLRFLRSASSAMPRELAAALEELFQVPLLEAYGMTEAAPQIASNRLPPHVRKPGSVGQAAGPEIAIVDGEITIRGENVCAAGWLRTGDHGYLDEEGYLFVTGRRTEVINRGGEKIAPQEIDAALLEHPAVAEAAAFGVPHPTLGEHVAAAVVLRAGAAVTASALRRFVAERLASFKVPQPIVIVDAIPAGPSGKLQRRGLAELLQLGPAGHPVAPVSELETRVLGVVEEVLGNERLGTRDDFFEAGGDSLSAMRVIARLNGSFGIELAADSLFEHPTVAELAAHLASRTSAGGTLLVREQHGERQPLSFGQQRLWLLDQLEPGNPTYNMQVGLRWTGALDAAALEESLSSIRRRHEVLRTAFPAFDGQPFARVAEPAPLRLPMVTLTRLRPEEREGELRRLAIEERERPFHLARETPFRLLLVQLDAHEHVLLLTMHHIVADGWSTRVLMRELGVFYTWFAGGPPTRLPELPVQYADVAAWQRRVLEGSRAAQLRYWSEALAGMRTELELPADRPRPPQPTHNGAEWVTTIGRETVARLEALAREEGATLFMATLAAFQVLLMRYSGQEDLAVGTPVANRAHPATEGLIGFFANTLVMRGDLSGDPPFRAYLGRVRRFARGAFANQDVPFDDVVDALRPPRRAGRTPLFQLMFAFQNFPGWSGAFPRDLEVTTYSAGAASTKFDLTLYLSESADGLRLVWQYATDLWEEPTIAAMAAAYAALVEGIVADPDRQLSALPLAVPRSSSGSSEFLGGDEGFLERFASQVARRPEALAVRCGSDALTYRALDEQAQALAERLRRHGAGPGTLVGVCLPRSVDALVALLAVWKAGGAYLPIDPAYPAERIAFLLEDAGAGLFLTASSLESLPAGRAERPADLAYVIYTSGSTGPPKGVMIGHGNVAYYLATMGEALGITADDRYLHTAPFAFSSSMRQFLLPLSRGAAVVIASQEELLDPPALWDRIYAAEVTVADLVPSYWRQLTRQPPRTDSPLRLLLSASETLLSDLPARWAALGPRTRMVNMYGQTETTGIVAMHTIAPDPGGEVRRVAIGGPIPGTRLQVIDSAGRPVPIGVVGELLVTGPGVGLGYLDRQEETARRFRGDAYRTGDLARRLRDGTFELTGRLDGQVKVRGFRVEPGEVEAALKSDPRVEECAVAVRSDASGEERLTAFVVLRQDASFAPEPASALRAALRTRVPAYLVPAAIAIVEALPRTSSGKLNRAALRHPEAVPSDARYGDAQHGGPRLPAEELLAGLWSQALGRPHVRTDDNFFDLGGDSLMGIRMIHEANAAGLAALTPNHLFQYQTLGALAAAAAAPEVMLLRPAADAPPMRVTLESARQCAEEALRQAGLSAEDAARFADVQIEASLRGQPTHNIGAIPRYARRLASGATNARPNIRVERETGVSALVDGDNGPGQLVALAAMELAMRKASDHGIGVVGVRRSNHFGAAGHYVLQAALGGWIGVATTNSALWLAPAGAVTPLFGTNPLAVGIPAGRYSPIVLDVSMSVTAKGKVARHLEEGRPLPPGWILDAAGRPSVDPADLVAGLGIPIGGHKGYGLALVMEALSGVVTGAGFGLDHRRERLKQHGVAADFGHFFLVIDPELFASRAEFSSRVDRMIEEVKGATRMEGVEEILLPGEAELRARAHNLRAGLPLTAAVYQALEKYRREAGLVSELVPA